jgi:hypothetical protein
MRVGLGVAACAAAVALCAACTRHDVVDAAVASAHAPARAAPTSSAPGPAAPRLAGYELLWGDMHCHVSPPDDASDVSRDLEQTVELARAEKLDFVVLTPHVPARFFQSDAQRAAVLAGQRRLRARIAELPGDVLFVPGFEYTDHAWGHLGVAFGDLEATLAEVSAAEAQRHPARFFERYVARGGLLVVNHPLTTPVDSYVSMARADLSWRPFTAPERRPPEEIRAADELAVGFEAFNLAVTQLRDRWLLGDTEHSLRATLRLLDDKSAARGRRMTPVGGSDSHSQHLRATTFLLAAARTPAALREAVLAGRSCVRDPAACTFEARAAGGPWQPVGAAFEGVREVEVRAHGEDIEVFRAGRAVATPGDGEAVRMRVEPGACTLLRARVGAGFSAPVHVNCGLGVIQSP